MQDTEEAPAIQKPRLPQAFTAANAAEMGRRGAEARRQREEKEKKESLQVAQTIVDSEPASDDYRKSSLVRTRALIDKLEERLERARDCQDLNYLCAGLAKLRDIEQKLAGRPNPGNLRPKQPRERKSAAAITPEE